MFELMKPENGVDSAHSGYVAVPFHNRISAWAESVFRDYAIFHQHKFQLNIWKGSDHVKHHVWAGLAGIASTARQGETAQPARPARTIEQILLQVRAWCRAISRGFLIWSSTCADFVGFSNIHMQRMIACFVYSV